MADEASRLQYQAFSEHRLHFSRLFMQVAAFMLLIVLAAAVIVPMIDLFWWRWFKLGAGAVLVGTSFVLLRVSQQEDAYARLLRVIEERNPELLQAPLSARLGARTLVMASFAGAGLALIGLGATGA